MLTFLVATLIEIRIRLCYRNISLAASCKISSDKDFAKYHVAYSNDKQTLKNQAQMNIFQSNTSKAEVDHQPKDHENQRIKRNKYHWYIQVTSRGTNENMAALFHAW